MTLVMGGREFHGLTANLAVMGKGGGVGERYTGALTNQHSRVVCKSGGCEDDI